MRGKHLILLIVILLLGVAVFLIYSVNRAGQEARQMQQDKTNSAFSMENKTSDDQTVNEQSSPATTEPTASSKLLQAPVDRASERVSKKPFGIYITPATSPVQPEKFSGYHTGVDFEAFAEEQDSDVIVKAVCDGKLLVKRTATGYGGVAVQSCTLNDQPVTIVYGHVRLSSISHQVGDTLTAGEQLAVLGSGFSNETDGERKHLHLGIHKGSAVNITGYVAAKSSLVNWLNIVDYL